MKKGYILTIILLSVALLLSLYLGVSGHFFSLVTTLGDEELKPADVVLVELEKNTATSTSFVIDGTYLANKIPVTIKITCPNDDINVRARAIVNDTNLELETTGDFVVGDDGYYYYNDTLSSGVVITFATAIVLDEELNLDIDQKYILSIIFESLDAEIDQNLIW